MCYLTRSRPKSIYCFVVISFAHVDLVTVKTIQSSRPTDRSKTRRFSRRWRTSHDRWLLLNMEVFNFHRGMSRVIARQEAQQFAR